MNTREPLAKRMRPRTLADLIGQQHILGPNTLLYNLIQNDALRSIILYGPPGTGKTSIANVIANMTKSEFHIVNAVSGSKKDLEAICTLAEKDESDNSHILFIDEIHRFNKAQQDYLLPFVENGTIILIGATTENPYFEVIPAIVSRSIVCELKPLSQTDIEDAVIRALNDKERGLGDLNLRITQPALEYLTMQANGDVRYSLSMLELAAFNAQINPNSLDANGDRYITQTDVEAVTQKPHLNYDKDGDKHYDTISAFIKSMRGSDPDATLYYLARMIEAGEDPKFIARRIMVHAAEDVGIADPNAINVATSAALAVERIGMPEGRIILAEAALYIALAPKSNSCCMGIDKALKYLRYHPSDDIPPYLQDAHYKSAAKLGRGIGYIYPHDYLNHWVEQQYLPDAVVGQQFYDPQGIGYQQTIEAYRKAVRDVANQNPN